MTDPHHPTGDDDFSPAARGLIIAAALCVVIAGLRAADTILVPLLFSIFLAILLAPALGALQRLGVPTIIAYLLVTAAVMIVGLAVIAAVGVSLSDFLGRIPDYANRLDQLKASWLERLKPLGLEPSDQARSRYLGPEALVGLMRVLASGLASFFANGFLILVTTVFLLAEAAVFPSKAHTLPGGGEGLLDEFRRIVAGVRGYMAIKTWVSLLTGVLVTCWLLALRVRYPGLWGLLAFALNFVPNIGPILAAVPVVVVALLDRGPATAGLVVMGYLVVNLLFGYVVEPRWMGRGLDLSPLVVLLSLVFWGWVFGPPGMLLSVPLTMAVKIAPGEPAGDAGPGLPARRGPARSEGRSVVDPEAGHRVGCAGGFELPAQDNPRRSLEQSPASGRTVENLQGALAPGVGERAAAEGVLRDEGEPRRPAKPIDRAGIGRQVEAEDRAAAAVVVRDREDTRGRGPRVGWCRDPHEHLTLHQAARTSLSVDEDLRRLPGRASRADLIRPVEPGGQHNRRPLRNRIDNLRPHDRRRLGGLTLHDDLRQQSAQAR